MRAKKVNGIPTLLGIALCISISVSGPSFAQWPGEKETTKRQSGGWPTIEADRNRDPETQRRGTPGSVNHLLCAFDYMHAARALNQFRVGRSGRPVCPAGGTNYGSYFSGDRRKALEDLIKQAGVRRDRVVAVEKPGFRNAAAVLCEAHDGEIKRLIIWDARFLAELDRKAGTSWASVAVLAHEIAHHLNLDTGQNPQSIPPHERRQQELYADLYAGAKLRQLGASKREAVAVFYHMGAGGSSHPPSERRVAAAGRGWDGSTDAGSGRGGDRKPGYNPPVGSGRYTPPPSQRRRDSYRTPRPQRRFATICVTPRGFCRNNPMLGRVPMGARCACYTSFGVFPGIGR